MISDPFGDCIADEGVQVEVVRFSPTTVDKGRATDYPEEKRFCIVASIQPLTAKSEREEMKLLPEGILRSGVRVAYTTTELLTAKQSESEMADRVIYNGLTFQVHAVEDWFDLGGYYRCLIVRMGQ